MNALNTMVTVHDRHDMDVYTDKNRPVLITRDEYAEDIRRAPDYSGCDLELFEESMNMREIDTFFVDSSGCGAEDEPALTFKAFLRKLKAVLDEHEGENVYAILSGVGQFQVYITLFVRR